MRLSALIVCFGVAATLAARAQATYPYLAELKQHYTAVKNNHLRMAGKMPEEHYAFKPSAEVRTFAEGVAHVAESQTRSCSLAGGQPAAAVAGPRTKAELLAALAGSFAVCDAAFEGLTEATAGQMVRLGQSTRERSKLGLLAGMISHSNEQYGYLSVYLRLKGLVPPSSEGQ